MADNLLIVGASARAAAFSALRAGLQPWCADLFADADLVRQCSVIRLSAVEYPQGFARLIRHEIPGPWMYSGGLENYPELVETIRRDRQLWGIGGGALWQSRNPYDLAETFRKYGIVSPAVEKPVMWGRSGWGGLPTTGWLLKPLAGAGGTAIRQVEHPPQWQWQLNRCYLQEFVPGKPIAALFAGRPGEAQFLGATRQLVGEVWLHARPFSYCGSIGPVDLDPLSQLARIGQALVEEHGLRGLFGVDCIHRDGVPYPVEVNPRYTASVEVLEYASGTPLLAQHRAVFDPTAQGLAFRARPALSELVGKAILFAKEDLTFPNDGPWMPTLRTPGDIWEMPAFADIPHAGERIEKGKPILTFFARGPTEEAVLAALQATAGDLERWLFRS